MTETEIILISVVTLQWFCIFSLQKKQEELVKHTIGHCEMLYQQDKRIHEIENRTVDPGIQSKAGSS